LVVVPHPANRETIMAETNRRDIPFRILDLLT
jgi:hypothetical protein